MNYKKIITIYSVFLTLALACSFCTAFASDYQYKILDPKYNSSIDNYAYDEETGFLEEKKPADNKKHPYRNIAITLALLGGLLVYRTIRVLKKVDRGENMENFDLTKEFFAVEKAKKLNKTVVNAAQILKDNLSVVKHSTTSNPELLNKKLEEIKLRKHAVVQTASKPVVDYQKPVDRYVKAGMHKMKNPLLINTSKLANNKGLCLVEYKKKFTLIGYIDDEIFMLNNFDSLSSSDIRARLSESFEDKDRYIVRLGSYKALVEVSDKKMELLLEL